MLTCSARLIVIFARNLTRENSDPDNIVPNTLLQDEYARNATRKHVQLLIRYSLIAIKRELLLFLHSQSAHSQKTRENQLRHNTAYAQTFRHLLTKV